MLCCCCAQVFEHRAGPSEYQGLMHALKSKIDDSTEALKEQFSKVRADSQNHQREMEALKEQLSKVSAGSEEQIQAFQSQFAEVLQILRSKP